MSRSPHQQGRHLAGLVALGVGVLCACTVDTSEIKWVPDMLLDGEGAEAGDGGVANIGGVANVGGVVNIGGIGKGGSPASAGSGGAGTGGSKQMGGMPGGGIDAGGMPGGGAPSEMCLVVRGDPAEPVLDDLEDGDNDLPRFAGRQGGWYVVNDMTGNQMPSGAANMPVVPTTPGFMSSYAMHTVGGGFTEWGAVLGLVLLPQPPPRPPCPYDLSRHSGLRFAVRGMTSGATVWVQVATVQTHRQEQGGTCMLGGDCGDHHGIFVPVSATWTSVDVNFSDLAQNGWGAPFDLDLRQVLNIEFLVGANSTFDLWVDQLAFY